MPIKQLPNLNAITNNYDVFFIDLWGVIHDGIATYNGVHEALAALKSDEKTIIFISNAPRRSFKATEGLQRLGIEKNLYDGIITSGEVVFEWLNKQEKEGATKTFLPLVASTSPLNFIIIGPERDAGLLDNTSYIKVDNIQNADFMIVTGFDNDDSTLDEKQHYLDEAIKLNLPLICANPDMVVVRKTGKEALCAGVIAKKYEEMGGRVLSFGKPYTPIYERAFEMANHPDKTRIAAIGDSLITDIKGANDFGIDSYLIPGGILGAELGIKHGELPDADKLQRLCNEYAIIPTGVLPEFAA